MPLKVLCEKFAHTRFEPSGWTGNEQIGYAKSLMDYIFRWLQLRFLSGQQLSLFTGLGAPPTSAEGAPSLAHSELGGLQASGEPRVGLTADQHQPTRGMGATHSPQGGIAPEPQPQNAVRVSGDPESLSGAGSRNHPCRRRHARNVRHGRRAKLRSVRGDHGAEWELLSVHELRVDERVQLAGRKPANQITRAPLRRGSLL